MSLHKSFKSSNSLKGHRNVLKRFERIKKMIKEERFDENKESVFKLPKIRSIKISTKSK